MTVTKGQIAHAVELAIQIGGIIRDIGPIPSGHLYTMLMPVMNLATYESLITLLVNQQLVRRGANHMLHWIGDDHNGRGQATQRN